MKQNLRLVERHVQFFWWLSSNDVQKRDAVVPKTESTDKTQHNEKTISTN